MGWMMTEGFSGQPIFNEDWPLELLELWLRLLDLRILSVVILRCFLAFMNRSNSVYLTDFNFRFSTRLLPTYGDLGVYLMTLPLAAKDSPIR